MKKWFAVARVLRDFFINIIPLEFTMCMIKYYNETTRLRSVMLHLLVCIMYVRARVET